MGARYDLAKVHEAARDKRIELDEARARDEVAKHVERFIDAYPFAADVLLELRGDDFSETVELDRPHAGHYDVYGLRISDELADKHGVRPRGWYVKLRLYESWSGETVFLVSLHPLEFDMQRVGGLLSK